MSEPSPTAPTEPLRHIHARLVATLTRRAGVEHLSAVEDAVQTAMLRDLQRAADAEPPRDRFAWLLQVASNALRDALRTGARRQRILDRTPPDTGPLAATPAAPPRAHLRGELPDDQLRMLLCCCDPALPPAAQLALALRTLCGLTVPDIAPRLGTSEANVHKRLQRARTLLRAAGPQLDALSPADYPARVPGVHRVLHALFTEGHLSYQPDSALRRDVCEEALRLGYVLIGHPAGDGPATAALLALMHLHLARMAARTDAGGVLLLLHEQDRGRWDRGHAQAGMRLLAASARGGQLSRYHLEAGIAAEHVLSPSVAATDWARIADDYAQLQRIAPSPLHALGRAVALAEAQGPAAGLASLADRAPPSWLSGAYQWAAVQADLHRRCGHPAEAARYRRAALEGAPTPAIRALLERRLGTVDRARGTPPR